MFGHMSIAKTYGAGESNGADDFLGPIRSSGRVQQARRAAIPLGFLSDDNSTIDDRRIRGLTPLGSPRYFCRSRHFDRARGFTIVEMIGTCLLLGILFSITVPMLLVVARERRSTEQRQFAMQHATNLLEHAMTRDWSDLEPGELSLPAADVVLQTVLPGLERTLVVKPLEGEPESRQITASIRWQDRTGELVSPLRLCAWVYPLKEVP